ncbi:MAG: SLBB domain-containing protein [Acidiferrobacterales bacterium]|nr:SLBB domain-containing protein [Acidiferrobacterales bacterium]
MNFRLEQYFLYSLQSRVFSESPVCIKRTREAILKTVTVGLIIFLASCGGSRVVNGGPQYSTSATDTNQTGTNQQIMQSAARATLVNDDLDYYLGTGDVLELNVFQVPELNKKVRINERGNIVLPMLGILAVQGLTIPELEERLTEKLEADFLQNPQVSVFVDEYRSQQITVMGSVKNPNVYSVRQSRSVFEMLSLAGGVTDEAGDLIRVETLQVDPQTGQAVTQNLVLSLSKLLQGADQAANLRLNGGDSLMVPEAGVVFIEGAVEKPGSYKLTGETTVWKAITLAGGVPWEGKQSRIEVIREIAGEPIAIDVNLNEIRNQESEDLILKDGDIIVVSYNIARRAVSGFFRAAGRIVGYSLN